MEAIDDRIGLRVRHSITGRIRFLSHLEMVEAFLSAFRRAGIQVALTQGMKPRPVTRMLMPRPVGVEAESDVLDIHVLGSPDPEDVASNVGPLLPEGVDIISVDVVPATRRRRGEVVTGAVYRARLASEVQPGTVDSLNTSLELAVERATPKQRRTFDARPMLGPVELVDGDPLHVRWTAFLGEHGSIRINEFIDLLEQHGARQPSPPRITREAIIVERGTTDETQSDRPTITAGVC